MALAHHAGSAAVSIPLALNVVQSCKKPKTFVSFIKLEEKHWTAVTCVSDCGQIRNPALPPPKERIWNIIINLQVLVNP